MEWTNYINCIFFVHNSLYSVLVNIIRDACFYGYTALPNCFYLVNNVFNVNVFLLSQVFLIYIRNSHFLQLYTIHNVLYAIFFFLNFELNCMSFNF